MHHENWKQVYALLYSMPLLITKSI